MNNKLILEKLDHLQISYKTNYDLSRSSYFRTGGYVDLVIYPNTIEKFTNLVSYFSSANLDYSVFGSTTNCIFKDDTNLNVIVFTTKMNSISIESNIHIEAGTRLPKMCNVFAKESISGFEELQGIPATLGGAVYMNAGCYGNEISKYLISVQILTKDGQVEEFQKDECKFDYRYSIFHEMECFILSAKFIKKNGNRKDLLKKISKLHQHRHDILEYDYRNVGSVFVTHDLYMDLAKSHIAYKIELIFIRLFVYKIFRVKTNKLLNIVTFNFFNLGEFSDIVSIKTMNVVINNGVKTDVIEKYISRIQFLTGNRVEIELI